MKFKCIDEGYYCDIKVGNIYDAINQTSEDITILNDAGDVFTYERVLFEEVKVDMKSNLLCNKICGIYDAINQTSEDITILNDAGDVFTYERVLFEEVKVDMKSNLLCNKICGRKYKVLYKTINDFEMVTTGILENFNPTANIVLNGDKFNIIKYSNIIQMEEIIDNIEKKG